jgi:hypothetical protein
MNIGVGLTVELYSVGWSCWNATGLEPRIQEIPGPDSVCQYKSCTWEDKSKFGCIGNDIWRSPQGWGHLSKR